jgi:hypothetical protein
MSNTIVRIALVNILLAGIFVAVITLQSGSVVSAAIVLGGLALLINGVFLMGTRSIPNPGSTAEGTGKSTGSGSVPMARTLSAAEAARLPLPRKQRVEEPHEMPPWLRVKDNIVMTWQGKHHVAPIKGEDPFEVAQRLHARLRAAQQAQAVAKADGAVVGTSDPDSACSMP